MDPIGRGMRYGLIRPIQAERHRNKTVQPQKGGPHGCRAGERRQKLSILRFLAHFREELTIVLATASSDAVLPQTWVRGPETHALNPSAKSVIYRRRISGVCLGRGGGFGCLDYGHELLRC
jgi:hypothetical protein